MTPIDINAVAANLAAARAGDRPATGTTARSGVLLLVESVERLIDDAALAGAFADLADKPSVEVSTLTHADRTVWICFEFDRDRQLLRAGPVPVTEFAGTDLSTANGIATALGIVRHLMARAIVLDHRITTAPVPLVVSPRASRARNPMLTVSGPAFTDAVLEVARTVALAGIEDPNGPAWHLGRALADLKATPPSAVQTIGPEALPPTTEDALDRADQAERELAGLISPPDIGLNLFGAASLVTGIIRAISTGVPETDPAPLDAVAIACTKRREACENLLSSVRRAQQFTHEQASKAPYKKAIRLLRRISRVNATAVQNVLIAVLLSDLAENAAAQGEPYCARAADAAATGFEAKLVRIETDAWNIAVDALHQVVDADERALTVSNWERTTGALFAGDWRHR